MLFRLSIFILTLILAQNSFAKDELKNSYTQENFVANKEGYKPTLAVDERFINAWGISIRPQGAGGHFWVTAKDISFEYVGDVRFSTNEVLRKIHQDDLKEIKLPVGGVDNFSTGTVFNGSDKNFVITQKIDGKKPITAPAKFLFSSDGGIISAWTERKNKNGTKDFPQEAVTVIDESAKGSQFFGLTLDSTFSKLYAADFGQNPQIKVYDGSFKPLALNFDTPFDENKNGKVDAGEYAPFNIQALKTPTGEDSIFVAYAKTQKCPKEEVEKGTCKKGELFVGEEDTSKKGYGKIAQFTEDGKLIAVWNDKNKLSAPWGFAFAPSNFGALSNTLLVSNFGDGTISAFDPTTKSFKDVLKGQNNKPIIIDKIWGILFGNGESLGDSNALYFAAGPEDEKDGIFGAIRPSVK